MRAKNAASYEKDREGRSARNRDYYANNRDMVTARNRERHKADPERHRAAQRAWWEANKDRINTDRRKFKSMHTYRSWVQRLGKHGLTPEMYWEMLDTQGGGCALCGTTDPGRAGGSSERVFAVDHCHGTGRVRGLLCHNCNRALGLFRDNAEVLRRAAEYVVG